MKGGNGGTVFMVAAGWTPPRLGKKWQKEKSKEMAKLEVCKVSWGRQEVCGFHGEEGQDQVLTTPAYTSLVGSPG